ncbi:MULTISPECIES: peroxiredoxin-like family protein [Moorena]|uniref:thioredoxin-dependent peroxiredoxin n=1 Tax=Moorena producens 3L TaxID=489825 RepID=F4XL80_9CYAN|nr:MULTISPECIES: peroxiredoxin-like family protein [Moorena]NES86282.1 AhpC/TSA family protein [Moorena sp. SIO2B7]EGJ34604.1 peroxiredoxin [Moorena producens 3L]NEP32288.1 AhpC/TSA family protein [Moorena sp. SIO3B2]NEP69089.1 AhpC/TSA family protein [Moorena sp. SIO3A5]NEQ07277.1 AhpC/TSA family protein [Moorena sp. SIO4E2]
MTLSQDLINLNTQLRAQQPEEAKLIMAKAGEDLANSGIVDNSLNVGDKSPNFTLPNAVGKLVELQDLLATGAVVISFYRGQWCPYCNLELRALQQFLPEIQKLGATLVAISPQTPDNSLSTTEKNHLTFEVLSDVGNKIAKEFGLVFTVPEELRPVYQNFGIDLPAHNGDETFELPIAATYVINPDGTITHALVDLDYTKRLDPEEIVSALQTLAVAV